MAVNKLRQSPSKEVADLAKELVRKWKGDVGSSSKSKSGDAQSPTPSGSSALVTTLICAADATHTSLCRSVTFSRRRLPPRVQVRAREAARRVLVQAHARATCTCTHSVLELVRPTTEEHTEAARKPQRRAAHAQVGRAHVWQRQRQHGRQDAREVRRDGLRRACVRLGCPSVSFLQHLPDRKANRKLRAATDLILKRARALEKHVYSLNPPPEGTNAYRQKMRSLFLNLKAANNPSLREDVVSGETTIARLVTMSPAEMASEEQQAINRKLVEENLFKAQGAAPQQAETDAFQCGKCKQRRTMYYR